MAEKRDPDLLSRLESEEDKPRIGALEEVTASRDAIYMPQIVASLYFPQPEVRRKAATALRGIKDNRVGDVALMALATEKDPEVIFDIILIFLYRPKEEAVDELLPYLEYPDYRVRSAAVDVLGALGGVYSRYDIIKLLLPLLDDERPSVIMVTLRALVHIAESLADREQLEEIIVCASKLDGNPNRMLSDLAGTVRNQLMESLSMLERD
jgi:HEAT repeat protein